mmetsp:Transcript_7290/g.16555  ORF Transcript_7290/g.16555 Transcript_7290/m.16555 type:complete len:217 (-) Transcript_7290:1131-1781(-)
MMWTHSERIPRKRRHNNLMTFQTPYLCQSGVSRDQRQRRSEKLKIPSKRTALHRLKKPGPRKKRKRNMKRSKNTSRLPMCPTSSPLTQSPREWGVRWWTFPMQSVLVTNAVTTTTSWEFDRPWSMSENMNIGDRNGTLSITRTKHQASRWEGRQWAVRKHQPSSGHCHAQVVPESAVFWKEVWMLYTKCYLPSVNRNWLPPILQNQRQDSCNNQAA